MSGNTFKTFILLAGLTVLLLLIGQALGGETPFIQTIFSPLSQARNLVGPDVLPVHLRQHPQVFMCVPKEPMYFGQDLTPRYRRMTEDEYLALFRDARPDQRAVQLLLGHSKIESTVRYLGIEVDDAIEIAEKIDI